jgi:hypothetical protein
MKIILAASMGFILLLSLASPFTMFGIHNEPWVPLSLAVLAIGLIALVPSRR